MSPARWTRPGWLWVASPSTTCRSCDVMAGLVGLSVLLGGLCVATGKHHPSVSSYQCDCGVFLLLKKKYSSKYLLYDGQTNNFLHYWYNHIYFCLSFLRVSSLLSHLNFFLICSFFSLNFFFMFFFPSFFLSPFISFFFIYFLLSCNTRISKERVINSMIEKETFRKQRNISQYTACQLFFNIKIKIR